MPFNIGPGELILVLIIALIVVGPGKLPDVGAAIGKSLREFRRAASDVSDAVSVPPTTGAPPVPPAVQAVPPTVQAADPAAALAPPPEAAPVGGAAPTSAGDSQPS